MSHDGVAPGETSIFMHGVSAESDQHINICSLLYVVIGGGLALNDIGFILVQTMCPMYSFSRSVTLFLSPGARSL